MIPRPLVALLWLAPVAFAPAAPAQSKDLPELKLVPAFERLRFDRPVAWASLLLDGKERIFVVEQNGLISSFPNDPKVAEKAPFIDLTKQTSRADNEEGLLGLAFHPKYAQNRQFFVYYSAANPRRSVVARFSADPKDLGKADPGTEEIIWQSEKDPFGNHNGGCIEFGPDGHLYITLGDSGAADDPLMSGQNPRDWWGSILRIDVDNPADGRAYGIPKDNPKLRSPKHRHWAPEVYCIGLRNVWKFSFDRKAPHLLYAGDVGQNEWEIVHVIENGGNYGWSVLEGKHQFKPRQRRDPATEITPAILEYKHSVGKSITGGHVYRGKAIPKLDGVYVFGDYDSGRIWGLRYAEGKVTASDEIVDQGSNPRLNIASFGQDLAGELYVLAFNGRIYRLVEE